jgi:hypothetical protein
VVLPAILFSSNLLRMAKRPSLCTGRVLLLALILFRELHRGANSNSGAKGAAGWEGIAKLLQWRISELRKLVLGIRCAN